MGGLGIGVGENVFGWVSALRLFLGAGGAASLAGLG